MPGSVKHVPGVWSDSALGESAGGLGERFGGAGRRGLIEPSQRCGGAVSDRAGPFFTGLAHQSLCEAERPLCR
jgi:hypothetical protein